MIHKLYDKYKHNKFKNKYNIYNRYIYIIILKLIKQI